MSDISALANVPEISFIENMTLQETEEQLRAEYMRIYREQTGKEATLGQADPKNLLIKAFALIEYQTMQYIDAKGRAELLKTSTGDALDALVALLGIERQGSRKAIATERFTLSEPRNEVVAIPVGTRVKTQSGRYFNTIYYAEIPCGQTYVKTTIQAEEAGTKSNGIPAGEINILVDPIPYILAVTNETKSTRGIDAEDDDSLTERTYLALSRFSCAGPKDAYEYFVRAWSSNVTDVQIINPFPDMIDIYFTMDGDRVPDTAELEELTKYISSDNLRPMCDLVTCKAPREVGYYIDLTYFIAESDRQKVGEIKKNVEKAVQEYQRWQGHLDRDLNTAELIARVRGAGAKRINLLSPMDSWIDKNHLPRCMGCNVKYGGLEDD